MSMILALIITVGCSGGVKYSDMIPNPEEIFPNSEITVVDTEQKDAYILNVTNFTEDEYSEFVAKCKGNNFPDVEAEMENDGGKAFFAYSTDKKYKISVYHGNEDPVLGIILQPSQNN